jgi:hypothetical protein
MIRILISISALFMLLFPGVARGQVEPVVPDPPALDLPDVGPRALADGESPKGDLKRECDHLFSQVKKEVGHARVSATLELIAIGGNQRARVARELTRQLKKELKTLPKAALKALTELDRAHPLPSDTASRLEQCRRLANALQPSGAGKAEATKMETLIRPVLAYYFPNPDRLLADAEFVARVTDLKRRYQLLLLAGGDARFDIDQILVDAVCVADGEALLDKIDSATANVMKANARLKDQIDPEEYRCIQITNVYRSLLGRVALPINVKLCSAARGHSKDMKIHNFFDHDSPVPGKRTELDRARLAGTECVSENIAIAGPTGVGAFWAWFESPGHHFNMLKMSHDQIGVGRFQDTWTENF